MLTNMKESTVFLFCFDENSYGTSFTALDRPMTDEEKGENWENEEAGLWQIFFLISDCISKVDVQGVPDFMKTQVSKKIYCTKFISKHLLDHYDPL